MNMARTLYEKLWAAHEVKALDEHSALLYIDRHLVHEVTSAQAFDGLREQGRPLWRVRSVLAVPDHNVETGAARMSAPGSLSRLQVDTLDANAKDFGVAYLPLHDDRQGIVHVVGPEQGFIVPGTTVVCGDSHTSTHGAFACLAFGIGTSEVEHVMATQTLRTAKAKTLRVQVSGRLSPTVSAKDLALAVIGQIGAAGGVGFAIEFCGEAVRSLSMEARMTLCNMAIEAGARCGLIAVDQVTLDYVRAHSTLPATALAEAEPAWRDLVSDPGARFDREVEIDAGAVEPQVTWGTSPEMVVGISAAVPDPAQALNETARADAIRALSYMQLRPGQAMTSVYLDAVFIGSCTNSRIEDLRAAAAVLRGRRIARNIRRALVVPGSGRVRKQAEQEGLDQVFLDAGFEWRMPGCSMCLGMNQDRLAPGERCASTSNRNFEGRQGPGSRTHLVSPVMAAWAAVAGHFVDPRTAGGRL